MVLQIKRTSGLQAPIMLLSGHGVCRISCLCIVDSEIYRAYGSLLTVFFPQGDVFSCRFDPSGQHIASAGFDRQIRTFSKILTVIEYTAFSRSKIKNNMKILAAVVLWNTYGDCVNYGLIKGHTGSIMELNWSRDGSHIFTCSTDKTLGLWDVVTGQRVKKFKGHTSFVNSCSPARRGPEILVSGGDDGCIKLWDQREKNAVDTFQNRYQITAVCFSDAGDIVFAGGIDNEIKAWDLRKKDVVYSLKDHLDTISGIRLSPDGSLLLSDAMDNTLRIWDVKPFAPANRCMKVFEG
ncbi:WD40-repeat-containing domain protein [Jimgerdemannia flammicorona]|uniref:WD40-repeat-containing domain protein n=1 Tax=Jimgerdemannia flammicorona TaxID=994334 RepID=A0A433A1S5_9FUNG|nr:WD40-repeat-containing domain protein [Jimgerdemannia flammicorona]